MKNKQNNTKVMNSRRSILSITSSEKNHITLPYKQPNKFSSKKEFNDQTENLFVKQYYLLLT